MKLVILQEELTKALTICSRFASIKAQLPVLANLRLTADKTALTICATNLETSVSYSLGAKIEEEGSLTIPAKTLSELVANLKPGPIKLHSDKEILHISNDSVTSKVAGMNASDFPSVPTGVGKLAISLPSAEFKTALSQVLYSVGTDEARPVLTGVLFVFSGKQVEVVATDGFRLSRRVLELPGKVPASKVIVPKAVLAEVARLEIGDTLQMEISAKDNSVIFGGGDCVLSSRVINGEFPDYTKIIPTSHTTRLTLDKTELSRATKLAGVFARDSANVVQLMVSPKRFILTSESTSAGNQQVVVDAKIDTTRGEEFAISFNFRFIEDFLGSVMGEEVALEFTTTDKPGVFLDTSSPDYLHLIMPVKV